MIEILKISLICFMFCAMGQNGLIFTPYQKMIAKLPDWLSWPLGKCHKCFTGQVMFWIYVTTKPFNIIELSFFVAAGILTSTFWNKLYCWLDDIK